MPNVNISNINPTTFSETRLVILLKLVGNPEQDIRNGHTHSRSSIVQSCQAIIACGEADG